MSRRAPSRRRFLQQLGASAALAPFVPLLNAHGSETTTPARLVLFFTPHATFWPKWLPTGSTNQFTLSPILQPLQAHQSRLNILHGVSMVPSKYFFAHTPGGTQIWSGSELDRGTQNADGSYNYGNNTGPSVDQFVASRLGDVTPYRSLQFGAWNGRQTTIFSGPAAAIYPRQDAGASFQALFSHPNSDAVRDRASVLDLVNRQLGALMPKLARADRPKLQAHLSAVRAVERRLQSQSACAGPMLTPQSSDPSGVEALLDIMVGAMSCDLTRVCSMQFGQQDNDYGTYPFLNIKTGHHTLTHLPLSDTLDENNAPVSDWSRSVNGQLTAIYTWYSSVFARLLDRLAAVPEGSGTMLDNTLVVWGTEVADFVGHAFAPSMPFVLAGGGARGLQTGRFLDFTKTGQSPVHNRLLVSICHFMGQADVGSFGNMDPGSGPLSGL